MTRFPNPILAMTFAGGRYRARREITCGLWLDDQASPRPAVLSCRNLRCTPFAESLVRYSVAGITQLLFFGPADQGTEDFKREYTGLVEEAPEGINLEEAGPLTVDEAILLGIALCDLIVAWAAARDGEIVRGLHPLTVFVTGQPGNRRFSTATPRAYPMIINNGMYYKLNVLPYEPQSANTGLLYLPSEALFTVALIAWYARTGVYPYAIPGDIPENNISKDRRLPYPEKSRFGSLLEAAVIDDPIKRIGVAEFRAELVALAHAYRLTP